MNWTATTTWGTPLTDEPTQILVLRGLPSSGKTNYALSLSDTHTRVSRDDIRRALTGRTDKFTGDHEFEEKVAQVEEDLVRTYIRAGRSVVVDDTNLKAKYAKRWVQLANTLGVEADVINFKVPLDELLRRNAKRFNKVPEEVIRDLYARFPPKQWPEILTSTMQEHHKGRYVPNPNLPPTVTFDLDGTVAHMTGRSPYDPTRYHEDVIDENLLELAHYLKAAGVHVGILTGRSEEHREVCEEWLNDNGFPFDFLVMRPTGDTRKDGIVKVEMFREQVAPKYRVLLHLDDRDRVVEALRSIGVKVGQVALGDF